MRRKITSAIFAASHGSWPGSRAIVLSHLCMTFLRAPGLPAPEKALAPGRPPGGWAAAQAAESRTHSSGHKALVLLATMQKAWPNSHWCALSALLSTKPTQCVSQTANVCTVQAQMPKSQIHQSKTAEGNSGADSSTPEDNIHCLLPELTGLQIAEM